MENHKIKSSDVSQWFALYSSKRKSVSTKSLEVYPHGVVNFSESDDDNAGQKLVVSQRVKSKMQHSVEFSSHSWKSAKFFSTYGLPNGSDFDDWFKKIESVTIDFKENFDPSIAILGLCDDKSFDLWQPLLNEFMGAIEEYKDQTNECAGISHISEESARRFLFLVPVFAAHRLKIYIDSSNGCFNVDISTRDNGVLTTQISESGQVYYSYVAKNKRIYKITGVAKFKDARDFLKFNKVLQML